MPSLPALLTSVERVPGRLVSVTKDCAPAPVALSVTKLLAALCGTSMLRL